MICNGLPTLLKVLPQQDWDLNNNLGWGPDYTDPSSYIDITSGKSGENANSYFGFDAGTDNAAAKAAGFDEYDQLIEDAHNETKDVNKRYENMLPLKLG